MSGGDGERFLAAGRKAYRDCRVKNSARRNSLARKTLVLEAAHRQVESSMHREQTLLRQHLLQMQLLKRSSEVSSHTTGKRGGGAKDAPVEVRPCPLQDVNPYPITFKPPPGTPPVPRRTPAPAVPARRGRRMSSEFEDLHVNTRTGNLAAKPPTRGK